jgi:hypothetical protein
MAIKPLRADDASTWAAGVHHPALQYRAVPQREDMTRFIGRSVVPSAAHRSRLLSTMFIDGQNINLAMIEVGLAEVNRGPESGNPYKLQYQAAGEVARSAKKGMWVLGDTYESLRAYRKRVGIS